MSLVSENSPVTAVPELDFYSKSPVQQSIESTYIEEIRPLAQLNTGGHIEFVVNNAINEYVKLKETTIYVRFKIMLSKTDNTTPTAADWNKLSVVNNLLHSMWNQIDLAIGDTQTTTALQTYPYRAYFETILGSTDYGRKSYLQAQMFYPDEMASKDNPNTTRQELINHKSTDPLTTGRMCELEGKLHLDMCLQHKSLIGGTKLRFKFVPNRPEFYFMCTDKKLIPKIQFEDIHLNVTKQKIADEILYAQMQALNVSPVKYIINRSEVRSVTIDKGVTSRNIENVINGQLPRRVYVAFVTNEAYGGAIDKNPFYFDHCNVNSIACFVNGKQFPRKAYTPNFENDLYLREFIELYRVSEQFDNDARMIIDRKGFKEGYTIFAFNLSPDLSQGYNSVGYVNVPDNGVLRFEIHFSKQLSTTVNALIFCEFDNQLSIPEDRNAFMDYR